LLLLSGNLLPGKRLPTRNLPRDGDRRLTGKLPGHGDGRLTGELRVLHLHGLAAGRLVAGRIRAGRNLAGGRDAGHRDGKRLSRLLAGDRLTRLLSRPGGRLGGRILLSGLLVTVLLA
jgi:hypothetical protein